MGLRGWSARCGLVAAASTDTGKIFDIVCKINSCIECMKMKVRREKNEISQLDYLEWYLNHDDVCELNHDGRAQVM